MEVKPLERSALEELREQGSLLKFDASAYYDSLRKWMFP